MIAANTKTTLTKKKLGRYIDNLVNFGLKVPEDLKNVVWKTTDHYFLEIAVADDVCVLESGADAWRGTTEQARHDSGIIEVYIGLRR